jgi:hypothetical protein
VRNDNQKSNGKSKSNGNGKSNDHSHATAKQRLRRDGFKLGRQKIF